MKTFTKLVPCLVLTLGSAKKLNNGQDILMSAEMLDRTQYITCYVMCDGIGKCH